MRPVTSDPRGDNATNPQSGLVIILVVVVSVVIIGLVGFALDWDQPLTIDKFVSTIRSWGALGVLASIGLMVLHSFIPFPAELLACANGMIYGAVWGTVITWSGAMLGAAVAFALARKLGRPFVERMVARKNYSVLDDWADNNGWQIILVSRFIPVIAFNLINYAAGLTRMRWGQFIWTTGVGILPLTTLMVVMGDNIDSLGWISWLILLVGGMILWLALRYTIRHNS